jgi:predicted TPR repeat methyltransferase
LGLVIKHGDIEVRFPAHEQGVEQDEEWCELGHNGYARRIRFHDYAEIYAVPGLYERIFYEALKCCSPEEVVGVLAEQLDGGGGQLRVLDVGAGNGMVGEELAKLGADPIVGVDIIEAAAEAAARDRPGLYADYHVADLTQLPPPVREKLESCRFNCLVTVAALGFGDIPPEAFAEAYNLIEDGGWLALNIKEDFLEHPEDIGFAGLIRRMVGDGTLELSARRRYIHRLSVAGEPIYYVALVARKRADLTV